PEAVQFDLLAVWEWLARAASAHLEDRDRLRRHDSARGQVVHVTVAHDAARRLAGGVEDDFLERVLDEDAALVAHAHHDRLVKTYRVGTRRRRPVQYLHRSHRYPRVTVPPYTVMLRTFFKRAPQTGHLMSDRISSVSRHRISRSTRPDSIARCRSRGPPAGYFSSPVRSLSTGRLRVRCLSTIGRVLKMRTRESRTRSSLGIRYDGI